MMIKKEKYEKEERRRRRRVKINLVLDFDKTLTEEDSISALVDVAYKKHHEQHGQHSQSHKEELPPWSHFTSAYLSSLPKQEDQPFLSSLSSSPIPLSPLQQQVCNYRKEDRALLKAERASIERIEAAGLFRGLTLQDLFDAGRSAVHRKVNDVHEEEEEGNEEHFVRLRPHWEACVLKTLNRRPLNERGVVAVVSVNWSRAWIQGCLGLGFESSSHTPCSSASGFVLSGNNVQGEEQQGIKGVRVEANEIMTDTNGKSSGKLERRWGDEGIWTAVGKERALKELLQEQEQEQEQQNEDEHDDDGKNLRSRTVYVGDSEGDLLCLLHADVGVIMRGDSNEMGRLECMILHELPDVKIRWAGEWDQRDENEKVLWWVRGFEELLNSGILD